MAKSKTGLGRGLEALMGSKYEENSGSQPEVVSVPTSADSIVRLSVLSIKPNPFQPRTNFDREALEELKQSIQANGLIQPVTVRSTGDGYFELISGERRLRAFRELGFAEIPAYVMEVTSDEVMLAMALIENIQRERLNPVEEGLAYKRLMEECELTQEEIAERVGKSRSTIANSIRLLKLPEKIRTALIQDEITVGHARALINLPSENLQLSAYDKTVKDGLSVRKVEELVKKLSKPSSQSHHHKPVEKPKQKSSAVLSSIEDYLRRLLATKVTCSQKGDGTGDIVVEFYSNDELERLIELFELIEKHHS